MPEQERDYYEVLGVARDADAKAIKQAYHRLAMKWHPDRNPAPEAEERFKEIAKAYAILSDPNKRSRYDRAGFEGVAHFSFDDLFGDLDLGEVFGGFGAGAERGSIFDRFFHGREPRRGLNLRVSVHVPLERVDQGGAQAISFVRPVTCATCGGYGTRSGRPPGACKACAGTGRKVSTRGNRGGFRFEQVTTCPSCAGRGAVVGAACPDCDGRGQLEHEETLELKIPRGIEDGTVLRVPGHGLPADAREAPPGDLLVDVYAEPDTRFQRHGADLWRTQTVDLVDAVLGTRIQVPTLSGTVRVTLPPGTQPDEVLRLRGKGLPRYRASGRGDLKLRLRVRVPQTLTAEQRALFEQLRALARS